MTGINPDFKMCSTTGPGPLMSFDSDEESFVVLGKSLINDVDYKSTEIGLPVGNKSIEEARMIIDEEIRNLDINSEKKIGEDSVTNKNETRKGINPFQSLNASISQPSDTQTDSVEKKFGTSVKGNNLEVLQIHQEKSIIKSTQVSTEEESLQKSSSQIPFVNEEQIGGQGGTVLREQKLLLSLDVAKADMSANCQLQLNQEPGTALTEHGLSVDLSTWSAENLQKKILEIVEENMQLRKTLEQNYIKMREQCNRIVEWQNEVKKVHGVHKEKILEAKEHIDKLTKEKTQKNDELQTLQEELHLTKTKLAELQVVQIEIQQSRSAAYVRVNTLSEEIQRLQQIIDELHKQEKNNDQMYALETQLELYKTDFEAERQAKETIKEEKEKICVDLQNLQRRNQQLQERIEMICDKDYVMYQSRSDSDRATSSSSSNSSRDVLRCPKCNSGFSDIGALQNHCHICIQ